MTQDIQHNTNIRDHWEEPIRQVASSDIHELYTHTKGLPENFYVRGSLPNHKARLVCIVGTRHPTAYGKAVTRDIVEALGPYGTTIVSGLAFGIDSLAHETALACELPTIVFPGSSLEDINIYPQEHLGLAERIVRSGGALISKYRQEDKRGHWVIPERNYYMAALAHVVIIVEARLKSGTLITAAHAVELNRDLYAVPGSIYDENTRGTHEMIKAGAHIVTSPRDIIEALGYDIERTPTPTIQESFKLEYFEPDEQCLITMLRKRNLTRQELYEQSGLSSSRCSIALSTLEIRNIIRSDYGIYRLQ